eukprot:g3144.t1
MNPTLQKVVAAFLGGLYGVGVSWVVNCTLVEISLSEFFSVYFGILFILIGGITFYRVTAEDGGSDRIDPARKPLLILFSAVVVLSGLLCFVLDIQWFTFSAATKVPMYTLLGVSVSFALVFSSIDLINVGVGFCCQKEGDAAIVESAKQVYLVLGLAVLMGAIFGLIFGLVDVEDAKGYDLRTSLLRVEGYCYPIGLSLGAASALLNEKMRQNNNGYRFDPLSQTDDFDL